MNPFQNSPKDEPRLTEEELQRLFAAAGVDWATAQKHMAPLIGIDPSTIGTLDRATVIVCVPWSAAKLEGSVCYPCHGCKSLVSVSPASRDALVARPELRALCVPCALKEQEERRKESESE